MNFFKFHQDGKPMLINLDNVTDIHTRDIEGRCKVYFNKHDRVEVDETLEQIQDLIKCGEK